MGIKCWLKKTLCPCLKQDKDDDPPYGQVDKLHDEELSVVNHDDNDELLRDDELSVNRDYFFT